MNSHLNSLAQTVGEQLLARNATIATAESCTGGGIGYVLTEIPGASNWFHAGYIVYSNQAKQDILGVDMALIQAHGAVSEQVVAAMAALASARAQAQFGVAVSGVAGPGGGSEKKPVGTVCIAWHGPGFAEQATHVFDGDRQAVRLQTITKSLEGLLQLMKKYTV